MSGADDSKLDLDAASGEGQIGESNGNKDSIKSTKEKIPQVASDDDEFEVPEPPDGGWGWVVMIASFLTNFTVDGTAYCFGVFLGEYSDYFKSSVGSTSLANALLCGTYLLVGPIVGALVNKFGCRAVGIAGSIISAGMFILSSYTPNIACFQLTYGFIAGCGLGLMYLPAVVTVGYYFERRRAIATGIAVCGTGIGTFAMAPLGKFLLLNYNWQNSHFILAGILLNGCVYASLMRPLELKPRKKIKAEPEPSNNGREMVALLSEEDETTESQPPSRVIQSTQVISASTSPTHRLHASAYIHRSKNAVSGLRSAQNLTRPLYRKDIFYSGSIYNVSHIQSRVSMKDYVTSVTSIPSVQEHSDRLMCLNKLPKPMADVLAEMLDIKLLKNPGMLLLLGANMLGMLGFYVPIMFMADRAEKYGVSPTDAAFLLSIMGICNTIGRVLSGFISFTPSVSPLFVNNICILLAGLSVLLVPFCTTYVAMAITIAGYGLFCSTFISLSTVILCELVGLDRLTNGFGLIGLVRGFTAIIGPPIEGRLYDITGNYDATFYVGGISIILSGVMHCLLFLPYFKKRRISEPLETAK